MITALGAVYQATHQRADLVRFYREKLGLGDPDHHGGRQFFKVGDLRLEIESTEGADRPTAANDFKPRGPAPRTGLCFIVDDLDAQVVRMKGQGVPFDVDPTQEAGGARVAVCRDPDGNFVTLMSGPRRAPPARRVTPAKAKAKSPAKAKPKAKPKAAARKRR